MTRRISFYFLAIVCSPILVSCADSSRIVLLSQNSLVVEHYSNSFFWNESIELQTEPLLGFFESNYDNEVLFVIPAFELQNPDLQNNLITLEWQIKS
jgi:hypothetical protein